jgi:hypothetical protein
VLQFSFSLYLSRFADYDRVYGPIATIVAALFFVYLAASVFLYGAEVAADYPKTAERDNVDHETSVTVSAKRHRPVTWVTGAGGAHVAAPSLITGPYAGRAVVTSRRGPSWQMVATSVRTVPVMVTRAPGLTRAGSPPASSNVRPESARSTRQPPSMSTFSTRPTTVTAVVLDGVPRSVEPAGDDGDWPGCSGSPAQPPTAMPTTTRAVASVATTVVRWNRSVFIRG